VAFLTNSDYRIIIFSSFFSKMTKVLLEADSGREFLPASPQVQQSEIYSSSSYPGKGKSTAKSSPSPGGVRPILASMVELYVN
jgi:hypothetical protein